MKIFLDPQIFSVQRYGGISRSYVELFSVLLKKKDVKVICPIYESDNEYVKHLNLVSDRKFEKFVFKFLSMLGISTRKLKKKRGRKLLEKAYSSSQFDVFVPTYYDVSFLNFIGDKPFVLTVYDMIHELFPQYFLDDPYDVVKNKKLLMEKATKIIAVSQNTKRDILKIYPHIEENKIEVIYHGSSIAIKNRVNLNLPNEYILFVGVRKDYKNFYFMLDAIHSVLKENTHLKLLCAGGGVFSEEEKKYISNLELQSKIEHISFKTDDELGEIYNRAKCFIFPSMYEGFGIPVLEAMSSGCPIVLTNNSSFPEVAGEAGIFYELNNKEDLKNKVKMLLENKNIRDEYAKKGLERIKFFTWNQVATQTLNLYKKAVLDE